MKKNKLELIGENFIKTTMDFYDIPGIAVGIIRDGERFTGAKGWRNYETKAPMTADCIFHCVSLSKLFTATGIMKLVEEGRLGLEDKLVDVIHGLPIVDRRWEEMTIYQMLSHSSGMPDVVDYHWCDAEKDEEALRRYAFSDQVAGKKLLWDPGEGGFRYSNIAYELLGLVIEEISGMQYEEYMSESLLKPAGMKNSTFLTFERTGGSLALEDIDAAGLAMPHKKAQDRSIVPEDHYPYHRAHAPSSTLTSNVDDLLDWAQIHLEKGLLKEETYETMWHPHVRIPNTRESMGLGWFMRRQAGYQLVGHEGMDDGFRAGLWICPELQAAVVMLCNTADVQLKKLIKKLFEDVAK